MSHIILPFSYKSLKRAQLINEVCEPLIRRYRLSMFVYTRIFDNGTNYHVTNCLDYQEYFFSKEFKVNSSIPLSLLKNKFCYLLTPAQYNLYDDSVKIFGLEYPLYIFERYRGFYDMYLFCFAPESHEVLNLYLNEMYIIEKFKFYFKEKIAHLIHQLHKDKLVLPQSMQAPVTQQEAIEKAESQNRKRFAKQIQPQRYVLEQRDKKIILTAKEVESIQHLAKGYTIKEIAELMHRSPRTIEDYLNNIKTKLMIERKTQIVDQLIKLGIDLLDFGE